MGQVHDYEAEGSLIIKLGGFWKKKWWWCWRLWLLLLEVTSTTVILFESKDLPLTWDSPFNNGILCDCLTPKSSITIEKNFFTGNIMFL